MDYTKYPCCGGQCKQCAAGANCWECDDIAGEKFILQAIEERPDLAMQILASRVLNH